MKVVAQGSGYVAGDTISCSKTLIDADGKIGAVSANVQATIAASGFLEVNTFLVYNDTVAANSVIVSQPLNSCSYLAVLATNCSYRVADAAVDGFIRHQFVP